MTQVRKRTLFLDWTLLHSASTQQRYVKLLCCCCGDTGVSFNHRLNNTIIKSMVLTVSDTLPILAAHQSQLFLSLFCYKSIDSKFSKMASDYTNNSLALNLFGNISRFSNRKVLLTPVHWFTQTKEFKSYMKVIV